MPSQNTSAVNLATTESQQTLHKPTKLRVKKEKPLRLPEPTPTIHQWIIFALDPSLSRTGFAMMAVSREGEKSSAKWIEVGSFAPDSSSDPVWIRSKALALSALAQLESYEAEFAPAHTGLLFVVEHPTPREDRLVTLNRVLHTVLLTSWLQESFAETRVLSLNASTLRSLMGLKATGAKNKVENVAKAYTFLDNASYPNLDTDACDAVLLATIARQVVSLLFNHIDAVPPAWLLRLCDATVKTKGKGRNAHLVTEGVLHRTEYWYRYIPAEYVIAIRNAKSRKGVLERKHFTI